MATETKEKESDFLTFIMDYEGGELDIDQIVRGFQKLIDSGLAWQLQGFYGRMATQLIESGYCKECNGR